MMDKKILCLVIVILSIFLISKISKSSTSSSTNYYFCIGQQGAMLSSSNYILLLNLGSPSGNSSSYNPILNTINFKLNLGFISECIESICCNFDSVCDEKEIQENCPDCKTTVEVIPFSSLYKDLVNVSISFSDSRYSHEVGMRIKIKLLVDEANWSNNECFSDVTIILNSTQNFQRCDWGYGKSLIKCGNYVGNMTLIYFPGENKININGICKSDSIPPGTHKITATIKLYKFVGA